MLVVINVICPRTRIWYHRLEANKEKKTEILHIKPLAMKCDVLKIKWSPIFAPLIECFRWISHNDPSLLLQKPNYKSFSIKKKTSFLTTQTLTMRNELEHKSYKDFRKLCAARRTQKMSSLNFYYLVLEYFIIIHP